MDWLTTEILTGFQKLLCLSLERTPAGEVVPGTVAAWVEALTAGRLWDEGRDTPRIRAAFLNLMRNAKHWPSPADFREALPAIRDDFVRLPFERKADPVKTAKTFGEIAKTLNIGGGDG